MYQPISIKAHGVLDYLSVAAMSRRRRVRPHPKRLSTPSDDGSGNEPLSPWFWTCFAVALCALAGYWLLERRPDLSGHPHPSTFVLVHPVRSCPTTAPVATVLRESTYRFPAKGRVTKC